MRYGKWLVWSALVPMVCVAFWVGCEQRGVMTPFTDDDDDDDSADPVATTYTLHLNLAGDDELLDELETVIVGVDYSSDDPLGFQFEGGEIRDELDLGILTGGYAVFELRGLVGDEEIAVGDSATIEISGDGVGDSWALLHRHDVFVPLEGDGFTRLGHQLVATGSGAVVVGGETPMGYGPLSHLVRSETAGYMLDEMHDDPQASGLTAARIEGGDLDGQVFIAGGVNDIIAPGFVRNDYRVWDPVDGEFTITSGVLTEARHNPHSLAVGDGKVIITGGITEYTEATIYFTVQVEAIAPDGGSSTMTQTDEVHWWHKTLPTGGGAALTCGGFIIDEMMGEMVTDDSCEAYDTVGNQAMTYYNILDQPRAGYGATVIGASDDELLLIGGTVMNLPTVPWPDDVTMALDTAEIINPGAPPESVATLPMVQPRAYPAVARFAGQHKVLICGGHDGGMLRRDCEWYDEINETFTTAENLELPVAASVVEAVVLEDGSALFIGGNGGFATPAEVGVIYFP